MSHQFSCTTAYVAEVTATNTTIPIIDSILRNRTFHFLMVGFAPLVCRRGPLNGLATA
jgi:hypothetical protein